MTERSFGAADAFPVYGARRIRPRPHFAVLIVSESMTREQAQSEQAPLTPCQLGNTGG